MFARTLLAEVRPEAKSLGLDFHGVLGGIPASQNDGKAQVNRCEGLSGNKTSTRQAGRGEIRSATGVASV